MDVTKASLTRFENWLRENGRAEPTVELYTSCMRSCAAREDGLTARLIDRKLAPKTRRANLAALRAWASFTDDADLERRLKKIKMPPANRVQPKVELQKDDWRRLVKELQQAKLPAAMRSVLLIMALRGLRSGDVLRLRRREVQEALRSGVLAYEAKGGRRLEYDAEPIRPQLEALVETTGWERVRDLVGGDAGPRAISNKVRRALKRATKGLKLDGVHPHRLRRTYATHFLKALDRDPQALIKLTKHMGWANIQTAAGYVDATDATELNAIGAKLTDDLLR